MTTEEIKSLPWSGNEKFALVNIETKEIFLGTDEKSNCIETLQRMTTRHPLFYKLKIIERPL